MAEFHKDLDTKELDVTDEVVASVVKAKTDTEGDGKNYRANLDHFRSGKTFEALNIPASCLHALTHDFHYEEPTQIQAEAIPFILAGRNVLAQAQTGSGKSIAFAIGLLNPVDTNDNRVQAICIAPTRHLASQLRDDAVLPLAKYMDPPCRVELAVRSEDPRDQGPPRGSSCPAHVVVGTAGTVIKWMRDRYIKDLSGIKIFVVDESDEMVKESNGGLSTQVMQIKSKLPQSSQILCFSDSSSCQTNHILNSLVGPGAVKIMTREPVGASHQDNNIFEVKIECRERSKVDILEDIYSYFTIQQSIVYCETKKECDEVNKNLTDNGFPCSVIHGKSFAADEAFARFRQNTTKVLICTDILARGIHVPAVAVVVNYNAPRVFDASQQVMGFTEEANCESYAHRIGRSSRMGNPGIAITLLQTPCDAKVVSDIEQYYGKALHGWDEANIEALAEKHAALQRPVIYWT
jgi:superfamily II DNA/RNA helicase